MQTTSYFKLECICGTEYTVTADKKTCTCPKCKRQAEIQWSRPLTDTQKKGVAA